MEREHPKGQSQIEKQPTIDGRKSLKKGLEIQKEFTSEYELTHKNTKNSLKKGEPDIGRAFSLYHSRLVYIILVGVLLD